MPSMKLDSWRQSDIQMLCATSKHFMTLTLIAFGTISLSLALSPNTPKVEICYRKYSSWLKKEIILL